MRVDTIRYLIILLLAVILAGCEPTAPPTVTPAPTDVPTPTVTPAPPPTLVSLGEGSCTFVALEAPTEPTVKDGYVDGELLLFGDPQSIQEVLAKDEFVNRLSTADKRPLFTIEDSPIVSVPISYQSVIITDSTPVADIAREFNEAAAESGLFAIAEPNYIVGNPNGGIHPIVGDPGGTGQAIAAHGQSLFTSQWAFPGVGFDWSQRDLGAGKGVTVAIFDTVPVPTGAYMADWFPDDPAYNICVSASANSETSSRAENNSHGLFIGGLVHALAPASDIHLIQVLDENATGTVSTLQSALYQFAQNNSFNLQSAIINLSLGIPNSALIDTGNLTEYVARLVDAGVLATDVLTMAQQTDSAALGLYLALAVYDAQGAVVVAASGNDGGDIQLPAGFPMVLGVAGSTIDGGRACFSNAGDMAAPGGDAGEAPCTKLVKDVCPADAPCDQALVSLVHPAVAPSGYAFWAGTSFATPLVSGLAAVARGQAVALSPDAIRTCILENADPAGVGTTIGVLGEGIADVPTTLGNCSP